MSIVGKVRGAIGRRLGGLATSGALGDKGVAAVASATSWSVERPKQAGHGDLATNAAMVLTKAVGMPPRAIAEALVASLAGDAVIRTAEVAGPGFVNLRLHPRVFHDELAEILLKGRGYGRAASGTGERVNLEFVSANPTGPITVAAARNAVFGDSVGRLLEAAGARVTREYYVNDFGNQVRLLAESVAAVAKGDPVPEDGYKGAYIEELAAFMKEHDAAAFEGPDALVRAAIGWMLAGVPGSETMLGIQRSLRALGVDHDVWTSEESLHRSGKVKRALARLEASGYLQKKDGALFFVGKGAESDDKDRVVQKSDGNYAYFASDIAYLADKMDRGYDRLFVVLGVDHHGYVPRFRNAFEALGYAPEKFEALLYNFVYILRAGEPVKSSKRAGDVITSDEVVEEIDLAAGRPGAGKDALRYFFLLRSANVKVDFDLEVAKKKSLDNPVFYVQYAHARLCSILKKAESIGIAVALELSPEEWSHLAHPDELAITQRLGELPDLIASAAATREPHKVTFYLQELAKDFQSYFTRGKGDPILPRDSDRQAEGWQAKWDMDKTRARLAWVSATRVVYRTALELLGVDAVERMDKPAEADDEDGA